MTRQAAVGLPFVVASCLSTALQATPIPYTVVAMDSNAKRFIEVNIETDEQTITDFPVDYPEPKTIAVRDQSVYFMHEGGHASESLLMEYAPRKDEWSGTVIFGGYPFPDDMELAPNDTFVMSHDFGIVEINPDTAEVTYPFETSLLEYRRVEVDSIGAIITSESDGEVGVLVRERPGAETADRIKPTVRLRDYALESDESAILSELFDGALYRLSLGTEETELVHRGTKVGRLTIDPEGRVIGIHNPSDSTLASQLVRVDLETGTEEIVTLLDGFRATDLDVFVVPEPGTLLLLLGGVVGLSAMMRPRQQRPASECRRRGSGIAA